MGFNKAVVDNAVTDRAHLCKMARAENIAGRRVADGGAIRTISRCKIGFHGL